MHVEGNTRAEALELIQKLATEGIGAAQDHARQAISGDYRHILKIETLPTGYAAKDGTWRGWSEEDRQMDPPRAYARWDQ